MTQSIERRDGTDTVGEGPADGAAPPRAAAEPSAPSPGAGNGDVQPKPQRDKRPEAQEAVHGISRREARLLKLTGLLGALLTLLVVCLSVLDRLDSLEYWFYDKRAQIFNEFTPPPGDRVFHIDIDDNALDVIGRWPWDRSDMARIFDEIRLAGGGEIAFDVILPDPQKLEHRPRDPQDPRYKESPVDVIDHDRELARSVREHGRVLLPLALTFSRPEGRFQAAVRQELLDDLELTVPEITARLRKSSFPDADLQRVEAVFIDARKDAAFDRILAHEQFPGADFKTLRADLLPKTPAAVSSSAALRVLRREHRAALAFEALKGRTRPAEPGLPPLMTARDELMPVPVLGEVAMSTAFVDYLSMEDGRVRLVPLWAEHRGRLIPQVGFALACAALGVDPADPSRCELKPDRVTIRPPPDADGRPREPIVIPVQTIQTPSFGERGMFMPIPWYGGRVWEEMYGTEADGSPKQHLSAAVLWELHQKREALERNNKRADGAVADFLVGFFGEDKRARELRERPPAPDDFAARAKLIDEVLIPEVVGEIAELRKKPPDQLTADHRRHLANFDTLTQVRDLTPGLKDEVETLRADVRRKLEGRVVVIGFAATARTDMVPTSLHPIAPGSVIHGVICNGILRNDLWTGMSRWVTIALTCAIGLLTTLAAAYLPPWRSLASAATLGVGYLAFNGFVLFDYGNMLAGLAAPSAAAGLVWAGCTLFRFIFEASERARVTKRFRTYVDPKLVDFVLENPNERDLVSQTREMTVVFTDLQGFTKLAEKLGKKAVPILSDYMGLMAPIIRRHNGVINKYLGDGIMFFFGAPIKNPNHAADAVATVLEMRVALETLNDKYRTVFVRYKLPPLAMRTGINSGEMVVGDTGPPEGCDYTVLGDSVNLASRLESANKFTGTFTLLGQQTAEGLEAGYLLRPIGRLQVVGKTKVVPVYEPLAREDQATEPQRRLAEATAKLVALFQGAKFEECLAYINSLDGDGGLSQSSALVGIYRELCERYIRTGKPADFEGKIVMTGK